MWRRTGDFPQVDSLSNPFITTNTKALPMSTDQLEHIRLDNQLKQVRDSKYAASESLIAAQEMMVFWLDERLAAFVDYDEERGQARMMECNGKVAEYQTRISDLEALISDFSELEAEVASCQLLLMWDN